MQVRALHPQLETLRVNLADKKRRPLQDRNRTLGIGLVYGPGRRRFLMSEVPLYGRRGDVGVRQHPQHLEGASLRDSRREFIDCTTNMVTDEDP